MGACTQSECDVGACTQSECDVGACTHRVNVMWVPDCHCDNLHLKD